ncbi:50S ribosomal protein L19e [Candidatus Woesearchaeota archaeon]|nr:50S ribosomal protein L19e [Candidatus Woesearchaeota archaeon]
MKLKTQKRIVKSLYNVGTRRVRFDSEKLSEIKEAITKKDIKGLVNRGTIKIKQKRGSSRVRARKRLIQRRKGRRKGIGSRKGKSSARLRPKKVWMAKIRILRRFLKEIKEKNLIKNKDYKELYLKAKGGFFRSQRHLKTYINERGLINKDGKK